MKIGKYAPSQLRKTIVATIGTTLLLVNSALAEFNNYLPPSWATAVNVGVGFVTAVSVFLTKNAPVIDSADNLG